ncbi:hypothetical protein V6N13_038154 [Hibiscus sabdariffa]|uniref:Uncharacterized protein n=1 Tax=Hibiscus sabdariffa TaxID=183260 RepID=A0ABR2S2U1_9ROSI
MRLSTPTIFSPLSVIALSLYQNNIIRLLNPISFCSFFKSIVRFSSISDFIFFTTIQQNPNSTSFAIQDSNDRTIRVELR